jgi:hypothetical protein
VRALDPRHAARDAQAFAGGTATEAGHARERAERQGDDARLGGQEVGSGAETRMTRP